MSLKIGSTPSATSGTGWAPPVLADQLIRPDHTGLRHEVEEAGSE